MIAQASANYPWAVINLYRVLGRVVNGGVKMTGSEPSKCKLEYHKPPAPFRMAVSPLWRSANVDNPADQDELLLKHERRLTKPT